MGTGDPKYAGGSGPKESAFATELTNLNEPCWGRVKVWAFGHTDWSCDMVKKELRFVSNQRGQRATKDGILRLNSLCRFNVILECVVSQVSIDGPILSPVLILLAQDSRGWLNANQTVTGFHGLAPDYLTCCRYLALTSCSSFEFSSSSQPRSSGSVYWRRYRIGYLRDEA